MNDDDDGTPYCWNGCGVPAVGERIHGMFDDNEVVELLCHKCLTTTD